jgi:hypothetical protein
VDATLKSYIAVVNTELVSYVPQRLDDPQLLRLQAKVQAVTMAFNEFARLDALAVQVEKGEDDGR